MNPSISQKHSVIQAIQLIIAPAVMINAWILLLGVSNKFSMLINRIRQLNEEKRHLQWMSIVIFSTGMQQWKVSVQLRELLLRGKFFAILLLHISLQSEFCYYLRAYWCRLFSVAINLRMSILYVFFSGLILLFGELYSGRSTFSCVQNNEIQVI